MQSGGCEAGYFWRGGIPGRIGAGFRKSGIRQLAAAALAGGTLWSSTGWGNFLPGIAEDVEPKRFPGDGRSARGVLPVPAAGFQGTVCGGWGFAVDHGSDSGEDPADTGPGGTVVSAWSDSGGCGARAIGSLEPQVGKSSTHRRGAGGGVVCGFQNSIAVGCVVTFRLGGRTTQIGGWDAVLGDGFSTAGLPGAGLVSRPVAAAARLGRLDIARSACVFGVRRSWCRVLVSIPGKEGERKRGCRRGRIPARCSRRCGCLGAGGGPAIETFDVGARDQPEQPSAGVCSGRARFYQDDCSSSFCA